MQKTFPPAGGGSECGDVPDHNPSTTKKTTKETSAMPKKTSKKPNEPKALIVNCKNQGPRRNTLRRYVHNRGIRRFEDARLEAKIIHQLRNGYEVRLFGDSIRLYHCLDRNLESMIIAASMLKEGRVRESVRDLSFRFQHNRKIVGRKEIALLEAKQREERRLAVTPDTMVTCPNCGTEFRVGRKLEEN